MRKALKVVIDSLPVGPDQARVFTQALRIIRDPIDQGTPVSSASKVFWGLFEGWALKSETGKYRLYYRTHDEEGIEWLAVGHRKEVYGKGRRN